MTELVAFGETPLRLAPPESERLETARNLTLRADGTESNVAVAAARLGTETTWVSKLPDSPLGRRVESELREHGLDPDVVWAWEGRQGLTFRETARDPREDVAVQDRAGAAMASVEPGELPTDLIEGADALFVAGSTPALSDTARETTSAMLRACRGTRVLDVDYEPELWPLDAARDYLTDALEATDVLVGTQADVERVLRESGSPREVVHRIGAAYDLDWVAITRADGGAVAWHGNVIRERDAPETDALDPNGAHEAFTAAFVREVLDDASVDAALGRGVAAAALARTTPGPVPAISRTEVDRLVEEGAGTGR